MSVAQQTLLVVEDNDAAREVLAALLRRGGYRVVLAANGEEAFGLLRTDPRPDLILLDMLLAVMDGWHFLDWFRREAPRPAIPVVIITAIALTREWAEDHGCQGFVHKTFQAETLLAEVRRCLG
jgi:CheY-like chemotaxis protein